ncbi:MAG: branched-chain amino acid aminotransferase [Bacteroidia bacterium]|nr:branched-chain amino acid aminotransferase [Bacteroidia bacterium]
MAVNISVNKVTSSKIESVDFNNLPFGKIFTDHMFVADYKNGRWQNFQVIPFGNLSLHPATSALHYGQEIFEGMKASCDVDGNPVLFRPEENAKRFQVSAERMAMPQFPIDVFMQALDKLIDLDRAWVPKSAEASLYIRPFMFATENYVGIKTSESFKFVIFCSPVGAYYAKPVKVYISEKYVRAFPGGVGYAKAAGNYASTLKPVAEVKEKGFDQILWLDGIEKKYFQEIGTMNVFFLINDQLITPELSDGTILEGITRDSVMKLARHFNVDVEERKISVDEVLSAYKNGELQDMFGTGTAATVSHISHVGFRDEVFELPSINNREVSIRIKNTLDLIKRGLHEDTFGWIHRVPNHAAKEEIV